MKSFDQKTQLIRRIAVISVHGCPLVVPGAGAAGGMNVYLREIAPLLSDRGICVDIFTRDHEGTEVEDTYLRENVRIIHVPVEYPNLEKEEVLPSIPSIIGWIRSFAENEGLGYDLIHSHYWLSGLVGSSLATHFNVPHAATYHTIGAVKEAFYESEETCDRKSTEASIAISSDKIMAFTHNEAEMIQNLFQVSSEKIAVAPGGVDLNIFKPSDPEIARKALNVDAAQKIILYVGRLDPFKGPDILIRAIGDIPGAILVIVGGQNGDSGMKWLKNLSNGLGVKDKVIFCEAMPQHLLPSYYTAAHVLAIPSHHESFGLVCLEAMACGTPVVAADVGALSTLVKDRKTGFLVKKQHPAEYTKTLNQTITSNDEEFNMLRIAALNFALDQGWDHATDKLLLAYHQMVALKGLNSKVVSCVA